MEIPKDDIKEVMLNTLKANNLVMPNNTEVRFAKGAYSMGNLKYQVSLIKNKEGEGYTLQSVDRNFYGVILLLHKAAGKYYFDILAIAFSVTLILLYISGLFITAFCKKDRRGSIVSVLLGFFVTALAIYFSI